MGNNKRITKTANITSQYSLNKTGFWMDYSWM